MGQSMWRRGVIVVVTAMMIIIGCSAVAVAGDEDALDTVREANAYYDNGQFRRAVRLYREAYDHLGDARLLYRIGLSYENIGNYQRAREFLQDYLVEDPDSPVRGRVEASITQVTALEDAIQPYLAIQTDPEGAEVYLDRYRGKAEGVSPAKIPVGAGVTEVTLVFPEGQRLQVTVEVGAGATEERFFQIGTAAIPPTLEEEVSDDPESQEMASEEVVVEHVEVAVAEAEEGISQRPQIVDEDEVGPESTEEELEVAEDVIPMPEAERESRQHIRLDYVEAGPPWWASTLAFVGIVGGHLLIASAVWAEFDDDFSADVEWGSVAVMSSVGILGGVYLLGRNWRGRMPAIDQASALQTPSGARSVQSSGVGLRWQTTF